MLERTIRWIGDWWWVLGVFVYGKVFRIKKYKPLITDYSDGASLVGFEFFIRAGLMEKLLRLWGLRLREPIKDPEELLKIAELVFLCRDVGDVSRIVMNVPYNGANRNDSNTGFGYSYDNLCDTSVIVPETPDCLRVT